MLRVVADARTSVELGSSLDEIVREASHKTAGDSDAAAEAACT